MQPTTAWRKIKNKSIVKSTDNPFAYKVACNTNRETGSN